MIDRLKTAELLLLGLFFLALPFALPIYAQGVKSESNPAVTPEACDVPRFHDQTARMEEGETDLLWIGDSITHFFEEGSGADVYQKYYGGRKTLNLAISGERTGHVLWQFDHAPMDKISPKMGIVMIGTNNIGHHSSNPAQTVLGIRKIVDRLKNQYPAMKILLMEVFPRDNRPDGEFRKQVNEINEELRTFYADGQVENVQLYGINDLLLTEDGTLSPEIMPDFLHPSAAGYEIWAKAIEPMVIEGLGEVPEEVVGQEVDSDSWRDRFNEKSELLRKNEKDYKILMLGDSITHYWEKAAFEGEQESLTPLWRRYYEDLGAINLGHAGDQTVHLIWRLEHYPFDNVHPKLAIVLIGVNDIPTGHAIEKIAYANRFIVKELRKRSPEMNILVLKMLPYAYCGEKKYQEQIDEYNALLPLYFRDIPNVEVVDIGAMFRNEEGMVNKNFFPDLVHPNRDGYLLWGEKLKTVVNEKLK